MAINFTAGKLASLLCGAAAATAICGCGNSRSNEVRGIVQLGGQPVQGVEIALVSAREAAARFENQVVPAISNLATMAEKKLELQARRESVEKERTLKVFKGMFPEVGPAEKEQLRLEIADLNSALTNLDLESDSLGKLEARFLKSRNILEPPWTNPLAMTRSGENGGFVLQAKLARDCWLAARTVGRGGPDSERSWLLAVSMNGTVMLLCETNAIPPIH